MKEIFAKIEFMSKKNRRIILAIIIFFCLLEAVFLFPLKLELSILNALMIYYYFMLGFVICATTRIKSYVVLLGIVFTNMLGLVLRIWLEWGEYSMIRDLTYKNVLLTYIPIITITLIGYCYTKNVIQKKSHIIS